MNTTPIQNLIEQLSNYDSGIKWVAVRELVKRGEEAIPALVSALKGDKFNDHYLTEYQKALLDVLASIGVQAIDPLLKLIDYNTPVLSDGACDALAKIGPSCIRKVVGLLRDEREVFRCAAVRVLSGIANDVAIDILASVVGGNDPSITVKVAAAEALASMDNNRALGQLSQRVEDIPAIKKYLAIAMGKQCDKAALEPLTAMLLEREDITGHMTEARKNAAWAMGEIGDRRAVPPLLEVVLNRKHPVYAKVLVHATYALGRLQDRSAVKPLIGLLKDRGITADQRASVCKALGAFKDQRAMRSLTRSAKKGGELERAAAIAALGEIGAPWIIETIYEALDDDSAKVRKEAVIALGKVDAGDDVPSLVHITDKFGEDENVKMAAMSTIERIGAKAVAYLADEFHNDPSKWTPMLQRIGEPSLIPFIQKLEEFETMEERLMAIRAMGHLGFPGAVGPLRNLLSSEPDADTAKEIKLAIRDIVRHTLQPLYKMGEYGPCFMNDGPVDFVMADLLKRF
jgi:HEAT repeat protein